MNPIRRRRKLMGEINVVPYIDVMLVLLVIFMITAPLLTQGVKVELPKVPSEVMPPSKSEPVVVSVDRDGNYYLDFGEGRGRPIDRDTLVTRIRALMKYKPGTPVMVNGDARVPYGSVVELMALLQAAGVPGVGLMTEPPETGS